MPVDGQPGGGPTKIATAIERAVAFVRAHDAGIGGLQPVAPAAREDSGSVRLAEEESLELDAAARPLQRAEVPLRATLRADAPQLGARLGLEELQALVEFAALAKDEQGRSEFRMRFDRSVLGGLRVRIRSYGRGRIGLAIAAEGGPRSEEAVAALVTALRERDLDIVDLESE